MATASSTGHIALWDLNSGGRLLHIVRGAHDGAVTALEWVPGQPVLISSGEDNSVKVTFSMRIVDAVCRADMMSWTAMVVRLTNRGSAAAQIPLGTPRTTTSYPVLWRGWETDPYSLERP